MQAKCLCGKIQIKFKTNHDVAMNCYCSICRRSHGAGYATQLMASKKSLEFVSGQSLLSEYSSSEMGIRAFCSHCGSRLMNYAKQGSDYMSVALSAVIDEHAIKPCANVQTGSKANWVELNQAVPCYEQFPDDMSKYL